MGRGEPNNRSGPVGQGLRVVHHRDGRTQAGVRPPAVASKKAALAIVLIIARECSNLLPSDDIAWAAYLSSTELLIAALALWVRPPWLRWPLLAVGVSGAIDEAMGGNTFMDGIWEYLAAIAVGVAAAILSKDDSDERASEIKG